VTTRIRFVVTGRVQGVAFRAHARAAAQQLHVVGFVANRDDGAVIGEAEGTADAIAAFTTWLHQGSPWSRVDAVTTSELTELRAEPDFAVRR
jgi:acylphosphatase